MAGAGGSVATTMVSGALHEGIFVPSALRTDQDPRKIAIITEPERFAFAQGAVSSAWAYNLPATSTDIQPGPIDTGTTGQHLRGVSKISGAGKNRYDVVAVDLDSGTVLIGQGVERELDLNANLPPNLVYSRAGYFRVHLGASSSSRRQTSGAMSMLEKRESLKTIFAATSALQTAPIA